MAPAATPAAPPAARTANGGEAVSAKKVLNAAAEELATSQAQNGGGRAAPGVGTTFEAQDKLPKLPIPKLEETCKRYLASLVALQDHDEHEQTKQVVQRFLQTDGPKIQAELEEYASQRGSYIEEFWDESYLSASDSVVLNLNPFFILEDDPTPSRGNQLMRTASLILAACCFVHDLRNGVLEPDRVRGTPLDMYQYTRLFGTARIPTANGCIMESETDSRHIVVMRRGQMYWFDVLDEEHRPILTERALLQNLQTIIKDADKTLPRDAIKQAMGILSTEKRKTWSGQRKLLKSHPHNARCLEVVDTALFVVCMDDSEPADAAQLSSNMLCGTYALEEGAQVGTCTNRWYDKLQIIVCQNGAAGINFEHTGVDGHTVLRFVADIYTELIMRFAKSINSATKSLFKAQTSPYARGAGKKASDAEIDAKFAAAIERDTTPKKLEWALNKQLQDAINFGETRLSDLICQNECEVLEFTDFGKNFITRHKFSPDAFVQMAFQAAYYTLYGRMETTYEPAMTKAFYHGRTEAIRTVQSWTRTFVESWVQAGRDDEAALKLLRAACDGHSKLSRACAMGQGHDRHLYAMNALLARLQAEGKWTSGTPELFRDAGYGRLGHCILSTSNCGNPALRLFGFGPVVPDGFGLGYIIKDDAISVCASSKHLQTRRFLDTLAEYLRDAQRAIIGSYKAANMRTTHTFIDHRGVECDVRTGLPIGSHQSKGNGYADDFDNLAEGSHESDYSFYGEAAASRKKATVRADDAAADGGDASATPTRTRSASERRGRIVGVGRVLLSQEYQ